MRLDRLIAEETYRPATLGTTLVGNHPAAVAYGLARGNSQTPLQDGDGRTWLLVDSGKPDGMHRPAPADW